MSNSTEYVRSTSGGECLSREVSECDVRHNLTSTAAGRLILLSSAPRLGCAETGTLSQFPGIDKSAVQEVLLTTGAGRCFVMGPNGS